MKRAYVPIREKYIEIVKHSRNLCIESIERRGTIEFKKTCKNLSMIG